jgi:hypothetical protein
LAGFRPSISSPRGHPPRRFEWPQVPNATLFILPSEPHRRAPLPHVLIARKSHAITDHRVPLPHVGFGPDYRRHPLHSVSFAFSCTTSLIGPLLTLPFPLRCRRNRRSLLPSIGAHLPPSNATVRRHLCPSLSPQHTVSLQYHKPFPAPPSCHTQASGEDRRVIWPPPHQRQARHYATPGSRAR